MARTPSPLGSRSPWSQYKRQVYGTKKKIPDNLEFRIQNIAEDRRSFMKFDNSRKKTKNKKQYMVKSVCNHLKKAKSKQLTIIQRSTT